MINYFLSYNGWIFCSVQFLPLHIKLPHFFKHQRSHQYKL